MRLIQITGILFMLAGGFILIRGFTYTKQENVIEVGDFKAAVKETKTVPPWLGGLAVIAGAGMIVLGRSKSSAP